ncbi:IPT/TIG domain-containing protein [Flammeovirga sp. OC4]|uniref:IPT/TIG domain-containing protein n=1 Tax=Flammeovirga sp. OC4 TaxID=1382345 RepID=UPI00155DA610|nr:IPT/TIG domain-containing protein [Flammeovirga sp. OC4]
MRFFILILMIGIFSCSKNENDLLDEEPEEIPEEIIPPSFRFYGLNRISKDSVHVLFEIEEPIEHKVEEIGVLFSQDKNFDIDQSLKVLLDSSSGYPVQKTTLVKKHDFVIDNEIYALGFVKTENEVFYSDTSITPYRAIYFSELLTLDKPSYSWGDSLLIAYKAGLDEVVLLRGGKVFDRDIDHEGTYKDLMLYEEDPKPSSYFSILNGNIYESNRLYFDYNVPKVLSFSPQKLYGGESFVIEGVNFGTEYRTTKLFANNKEIAEGFDFRQTNTKIECRIPTNIGDRNIQLKLKVHGHEILLGERYEVPYVEIDSMSLDTLSEKNYSVYIYGKGLIENSSSKLRLYVDEEELPDEFYSVSSLGNRIYFNYKDYLVAERYENIPLRDLKIKVQRNDTFSNEFTIPFRNKGYFTRMKDFPGEARWGGVAFAVNGKGYFGLGATSKKSGFKKDIWEYDTKNDTWTKKTDFPAVGRVRASEFTIGDKAYLGLGTHDFYMFNDKPNDRDKNFNDFYAYDPASNTWEEITNYPGHPAYSVSAYSDETRKLGYLAYGLRGVKSGSPVLNDHQNNEAWIYHQASNTWEVMPRLTDFVKNNGGPSFLYLGLQMGVVDRRHIIPIRAGGALGEVVGNDVYFGLSTRNTGYHGASVLLNDNLYGFFGNSGYGYETTNSFGLIYKGDDNSHSADKKQTELIEYGMGITAFEVDGKIYLLGGCKMSENGVTLTNEVWCYDPNGLD